MNILIPIILGSEVRQFVWSGIVGSLIDKGNIVYLSIRNTDPILKEEIFEFEPRVLICDFFKISINNCSLSYLTYVLDYDYNKSNNPWKYIQTKPIAWYKSVLMNFIHLIMRNIGGIRKVLVKAEQRLSRSYNTSDWISFLKIIKLIKLY